MIAFPLPTLDDDALHWGRVAFVARLIVAEGADLDSEEDCWRTLMRNGVGPGEAFAITPDAIRHARAYPAPVF